MNATETKTQTIFILWKETQSEFIGRRMGAIGTGELEPVFIEKEVTRRVRFSTTNTPEMMERAENYIATERPEGWIEVIEE